MSDRYYIWGAGNMGRRALKYLYPLGILKGIIDTDSVKHGRILSGLKIYGYDSSALSSENAGVIIAHSESNSTEEILRRDNIPFWRLSEFITEYYWTVRQEHAIGFLDLPITSRCSLNCKDCMQYIPYRSKQDVPIKTLYKDLEMLFRHISFVGEISIMGGEPFLHGKLQELLEYIRDNFRERIGSLVITTNGTILPDDSRILTLCRELEVFISVSDYSKTFPWLEVKISELESSARDAGVSIKCKRLAWSAPGRFDESIDFRNCSQAHMQLADGKLWRCTLMAVGQAAGFCTADGGHDYFDLPRESGDMLQKFLRGIPQTSQCQKCLWPHEIMIESAVQILE